VIDIGGRSTEMILGKRLKAGVAESHRIGSVSLSQRYFSDGRFTEKAFKEARISAAAALEESLDIFSRNKWDIAYGSSGTIGALAGLLSANEVDTNAVTLPGLAWCREKLLRAGSADKLKLPGLKEDRKAVIGGGIAILEALLESFEIDALIPAKGALRQGVLFDMLGRQEAGGARDIRHETVARMQTQFRVDMQQAERVEKLALALYNMLRKMNAPGTGVEDLNELRWVCRLHEIGMSISHSEFHRHGAYIVDKADAAGFSQWQQERMSQLMLGQRGSLRKVSQPLMDQAYAMQLLALRLAIIFCHARREPDVQASTLSAQLNNGVLMISLSINSQWAQHHPQTIHLLEEEALVWDKLPLSLQLDIPDDALLIM
jgi:exopolyphosphatase / guanosine-5'-triphosphate,3'-diphosphate pyrophosphatase